MSKELRASITGIIPTNSPESTYIQSLFDMEDTNTTEERETMLRLSALEFATKLGTTLLTDVTYAANEYLNFLNGNQPTETKE